MNVPFNHLGTIAEGSNRLNKTNLLIGSPTARNSQLFTQSLLANSTIDVPIPGTYFYVVYSSAAVNIQPSRGVFNTYVMGTGINLKEDKAFTNLRVQNPTANPILIQLWIGFDEFIDNRVILAQQQFPLVMFPTYPTANAATSVNITDLAGQKFTDINGGKWWAVGREAIYAFNPDAGVTYNIQKSGSAISSGPAVAVVYPLTSVRLPITGSYTIQVGGGNVNAIISENYYAIPQ